MKQTRLTLTLTKKTMASLALASTISYAGFVAAEEAIPPEPQLVKDFWTLETFFEADPEATAIRRLSDDRLLLAFYAGSPERMSIHWARVRV